MSSAQSTPWSLPPTHLRPNRATVTPKGSKMPQENSISSPCRSRMSSTKGQPRTRVPSKVVPFSSHTSKVARPAPPSTRT